MKLVLNGTIYYVDKEEFLSLIGDQFDKFSSWETAVAEIEFAIDELGDQR